MTASATLDLDLDLQVQEAYDALAAGYDEFTAGYAYDRWLSALEQLAVEHSLAGTRLLDVACGTGQSFLPMLRRGYSVTACDISERMLQLARQKAPQVPLHQADMRRLPTFGQFDLITCLDDALNYVLVEPELEACLGGFARNLRPGGIAIWDLNTLGQYRGQFSTDRVSAGESLYVGWCASPGNHVTGAGELVEVAIDLFQLTDQGLWSRTTSSHHQRHWPQEQVIRLACNAGLEILTVRGQAHGGRIEGALDESRHSKAVYLARKPPKGDAEMIGSP